ncbi:MAG: EAL domain-containing protein [Ectothiorhodospiraceae bacterium]|nr:EAL domain-containing protein [Ectothiorhodospiraceae bacterium]
MRSESETPIRVLVVESSPNAADAMLRAVTLARRVGEHLHARRTADIEAAMESSAWDLVLYSTAVRWCTAADLVRLVARADADVPVVAVHGARGGRAARRVVTLLEAGATDAVSRDNPAHLALVIRREVARLTERRDLRHSRREVEARDRRWQTLLGASREAVAYVHGGMHVRANAPYLRRFGFETGDELIGMPIMDLVDDADRARLRDALRDDRPRGASASGAQIVEVTGRRVDGGTLPLRIELTRSDVDGEECWQVVLRDPVVSPTAAAELERLRRHDPVTGALHRTTFVQALDALPGPTADDRPAAMLVLELDDLQRLEEAAGVETVDRLMASTADLLGRALDEHEALIGRVSDGALAALLPAVGPEEAGLLAEAVRELVELTPVEREGRPISCTCSIGVEPFRPQVAAGRDALLAAQARARAAASAGGNQVRSGELETPVAPPARRGPDLADVTARAMAQGRIHLAFQPIVKLTDESARLYEVLLRLTDEADREIAPVDVFMPGPCEEVAARLDRWVVEHTVATVRELLERGADPTFFVNLSPAALLDENLLLFLGKQLRARGVPGRHLVFEIPESIAVTQGKAARAFVSGLRDLQCRAAIEHYGSVAGSPATVGQLAVDYVKIDAALVGAVAHDTHAEQAVRKAADLARSLGRESVAFGVESTAVLAKLWTLGVDYVQGYCIQAPSVGLEWGFVAGEL